MPTKCAMDLCQFCFCYFIIISPRKRALMWLFILINVTPHYGKLLFAKFGWNWPSVSGGEDFKVASIYFCYFVIISLWTRVWPFIWTNLNPHPPRMLCAKFGWNWPSGSEEELLGQFQLFWVNKILVDSIVSLRGDYSKVHVVKKHAQHTLCNEIYDNIHSRDANFTKL